MFISIQIMNSKLIKFESIHQNLKVLKIKINQKL